jgi:hypothetical protein
MSTGWIPGGLYPAPQIPSGFRSFLWNPPAKFPLFLWNRAIPRNGVRNGPQEWSTGMVHRNGIEWNALCNKYPNIVMFYSVFELSLKI